MKSINEKGTKNDSLKEICEGITLIRDVLLKIFHRHGLVPIHPIGQKFDPNIHEAVLEIPESKVNLITVAYVF